MWINEYELRSGRCSETSYEKVKNLAPRVKGRKEKDMNSLIETTSLHPYLICLLLIAARFVQFALCVLLQLGPSALAVTSARRKMSEESFEKKKGTILGVTLALGFVLALAFGFVAEYFIGVWFYGIKPFSFLF